jgi:TonB family protein
MNLKSARRTGLLMVAAMIVGIGTAGAQPTMPLRVGGPIAAPRKIKDVKPVYPPQAQQARVQGIVILEITVDTDGTVKDAMVLRSIPLLDQAAVDAVRQWEYQPVLLNGVAVPVKMTVTVNFALDGGGPTAAIAAGISGTGGITGGVVGGPSQSIAWSSNARFSMRMGRPDGTVDVYELDPARAAGLPTWDPQSPYEPPLALGAAVTAARTWLLQQNPGQERLDLMNVTLTRSGPTAWMYQIRFQPMSTGRAPLGTGFMAMVLMDGSILEPRNEPR